MSFSEHFDDLAIFAQSDKTVKKRVYEHFDCFVGRSGSAVPVLCAVQRKDERSAFCSARRAVAVINRRKATLGAFRRFWTIFVENRHFRQKASYEHFDENRHFRRK